MQDDNPAYSFPFSADEINPDENPLYEYDRRLSELDNVKRKNCMIHFGRLLTREKQFERAVLYYRYLTSNTYFSNDWYPYRQLAIIFAKTKDWNANLMNIKRLLYSRIYLNNYQIVWFGEKIRQITTHIDVDDEMLEEWFEYYESHGRLNEARLNTFLADRFTAHDGKAEVMSEEFFRRRQERYALEETGRIYERVKNYKLAIEHYSSIINGGEFNCYQFYQRLCYCAEKTRDYGLASKAIRLYYANQPENRTEKSDEWFSKRMEMISSKTDNH